MSPLAWCLISLVSIGALHWILPGPALLHPPATLAGPGLIVIGLILLIQPARAFDRAKTDINPFGHPTTFLTDGWYRLSRNPMYLGMVLVALGLAFTLGSTTGFLVPPLLLFILDRRFVRHEEELLRRTFGAAYQEYCRRVRRWV